MKGKRGSHIDVIISFIVFIGIIIFLYTVIQPKIANQQNSMQMLEYLKLKILENVSDVLISVPVGITSSPNKDCVELKDFLTESGINSPALSVSNGTGEYSISYFSQNVFVTDTVANGAFDSAYLKIADSPRFGATQSQDNSGGGCKALSYGSNYFIGEVRNDSYAFASSVGELINYYDSNYDSLVQSFGVSSNVNFGFSFTYQNQTNIGTNDKAPSASVYVENFPIQYVNSNGNIEAGNLVVRVW